MPVTPFGLSAVTRGLARTPGAPNRLLTSGLPYQALPAPPSPNVRETPLVLRTSDLVAGLPGLDQVAAAARSLAPPSNTIVPTAGGFAALGSGYSLDFDPDTLQGRIFPALGTLSAASSDDSFLGNPAFSYTGSDIRIMIESTQVPSGANAPARLAKDLLECTTMTISVHRVKSPVSAAGYIGAKGFARGRRTIAGTMVLTQFAVDVLMRFLHSPILQLDSSKDSHYNKTDQLPPFNMTLLFANEMGFASYCRVLGVELMDTGTVYSQNDMYTEQTISYMASDLTPLVPITAKNLQQQPLQDRRSRPEKTVQDLWTPPPRFGPTDADF